MSLSAEVGSKTWNDPTEVNLAGTFQPKALITWGTDANVNPAAGAWFFVGLTDGTSQACVAAFSDDNKADSDTIREYATDRIGQIHTNGAGGNWARAALASFDSDGFTVTESGTSPNDSASKISYLALGGADLTNAKLISFNTGALGAQSVTGVGFKPDVVIFLHSVSTAGVAAQDVMMGYGWATADAQYAISVFSDDAAATMDTARYLSNTAAVACLDNTSALIYKGAVTGFTSDGFTLNWTTANINRVVSALCLKFTNPACVKAGHIDTGTSNGQVRTASSLGHTPKGVMLFSNANTAFDSIASHQIAAIGGFDGTRMASIAATDQDNAVTSVAKSRFFTTVALDVPNEIGGTLESLASPSIASGAFSLTATKGADTTARLVPYLSFGDDPAGGTGQKAESGLSGVSGLAI